MIYPKGIVGPDFDKGDIVQFEFDGSTLELRLPKLPVNHGTTDEVCSIRDFNGVDASNWSRTVTDHACLQLVSQKWIFEDHNSLDDVASCDVSLNLLELSEGQALSDGVLTNQNVFEAWFLSTLKDDFESDKYKCLDDPEWPTPENNFHLKRIPRPTINWLQSQISTHECMRPSPYVCIPINSRFLLNVSFELSSLHYPDRKNPYSDELLRKMEFDLFDDFLNYIHVHYAPEAIAKIEKLKQQSTTT
jgi:hypothetical protein